MRWTGLAIVALAAAIAYACGGGSATKKDAAVDTRVDAPRDASIDVPAVVIPDGPPGTIALSVKNFLEQCEVSVGSEPASPAAAQVVYVLPGAIPLVARLNGSAFVLSSTMWHHVDGDGSGAGVSGTQTGTGSAAQSTATSTITNAPKCVWVCCAIAGSGSNCPATDQCP
jgi:hypothetical protein